ncbi:phosphate:H+ symporter [Coniochaeta ligniaria NRRL 30616]|uniref:Phosphate:H+ symporter n=1 Tax=Coniochaeta ligniaria NRRL 30616 TaxID=1408157 RepID=A0A1J7JFH4_9PEZI|nr:phosphate:H+ symporter [Coniochaeta ligniaria NRRL 30616]
MDMLPQPMIPTTSHRTTGGNRAFHNYANDYSHITDPNLRRRLALSDIDKVPFGLYHVRAVLVAGVGFFLDSYSIFAINLITTFLGVVFWEGSKSSNGFGGNNGVLPTSVSQALKASMSAGIVIGQILFGWLADVFGRRRMYGIELGIIVLATLNCALASPSQSMSSTGLLTFWRVILGIGIGGDYPLSSIITSEFAPTRWRGAMMSAVFSMQGVGQLSCALVALIVTVAFKESFINIKNVNSCDYACQVAADRSWRIIVGVGAVPAIFALYYRITIPETPRYTFDVAHDVEKADADLKAYLDSKSRGYVDPVQQARMLQMTSFTLKVPAASWADMFHYFGQWKNLQVLIGTTLSWFFLDLAFYGLGLNNTIVLQAIGYSTGPTLYHTLYNNAVGMIILACAGSLPGYWTAVLTIDTLGRKPLQLIGFAFLTVLFATIGFAWARLSEGSLLALYVVAQFFFNWGPNTTTFIIPGECFPTRYRSTGHGLSAAMGKIGAIVAQVVSIPLLARGDGHDGCEGGGGGGGCATSPWLDRLMQIFALFMLAGTIVTLLVPETKGWTLEELAGERPNGYDVGVDGPGVKGWRRWSPFSGGRPAGFWASGGSGGGSFRGGRSPRVGIMTSPELGAQGQAGKDSKKGEKRRWGMRGGSERGGSGESCHAIVERGGSQDGGDEMPVAPASVLPGWGAGWGRVDGAQHGATNIQLHDVGSLLK